ncbi:unnamed protein product [Diatraea saccharalis]|uniref:Uncharacterized protein n=1 Tax=Diatraea saccharalis TaxID=40085 RepID=A0A9N9R2U5_9NEOP|nr:unnamed protein product [Diatraea saccharalis]
MSHDDVNMAAGPSGLQPDKMKKKKKMTPKRPKARSFSTSSSETKISLASSTEDRITMSDNELVDSELEDEMDVSRHLKRNTKKPQKKFPANDIKLVVTTKKTRNLVPVQLKDITNADRLQTKTTEKTEFKENIGAGDHVIVQWNQHFYPGEVISLSEEAVLVRCMKKGKEFWRWPVIKDEQLYRHENIVQKIGFTKFVKKGCFFVPEIDKYK